MTRLFQISMLSYRKPPSCEFHVGLSEAAESALTDAKYAAVLHLNRMGADDFIYVCDVNNECCINPEEIKILSQFFCLRYRTAASVSSAGTMDKIIITLSLEIQNVLGTDRNISFCG